MKVAKSKRGVVRSKAKSVTKTTKNAPMKSAGAEALRTQRKIVKRVAELRATPKDPTCECGKVVTDEPLAMCESCQGCDQRMHTMSDFKTHLKCLEVARPVEDDEAPSNVVEPKKQPRRTKGGAPAVEVSTEDEHWRWSFFFSCQRNPILRSQVLTALMAGVPLEIARLPTEVLLDVVLIATATREFHEAEVVDSYDELLTLTEEAWKRPDWTTKVFDSIHCNWADSILNRGRRDFDSPETKYVPSLVGWYLTHDAPVYFKKELTK